MFPNVHTNDTTSPKKGIKVFPKCITKDYKQLNEGEIITELCHLFKLKSD